MKPGYQSSPTDKQLRYIESLCRKTGRSGDAWDQFGMRRAKAQKSATSAMASALIERLEAEIKRFSALADCETTVDADGDTCVKLGGEVVCLSEEAMAVFAELRPALVGRGAEVLATQLALQAQGVETPWATAMRQVASVATEPVVSPRETALAQIRALMTEHNITASELTSTEAVIDVLFDDAKNVNDIRYRLHPIDVGYDLREIDAIVAIAADDDPLRVSYPGTGGERRVIEGPQAQVLQRLRARGFCFVVRREVSQ